MNTFDRFLNTTIKTLLVVILCIMLTIGLMFALPVYAEDSQSIYKLEYISPTPSPYYNTLNEASYAMYSNRYLSAFKTSAGQDIDFYLFHVGNYIYICCSSDIDLDFSSNTALAQVYTKFDTSVLFTGNTAGFVSQYGLYVVSYEYSSFPYYTFYCPTYSSASEGYQAVADAIASSGTVAFDRTITIKPGYVAYVRTAGGTLDLVAQFHEYSKWSRPLWDNDVRISFSGGLVPTSGTVFNTGFGSPVDWLKVASAPSNALGQTMVGGRFYDSGLPDAGENKCVVIYNPTYNNAGSIIGRGTIDFGPTITAHFSNLVDVSQYKLRSDATVSYASGASIVSGSPDDYNLVYSYIPSDNDPSTVITDSDYRLLDLSSNTSGPAIDMNNGGYNGNSGTNPDTPEQTENGILGLLSRILQFLATPISHIINLFNAGGNLMAWLGQLWTWLPTDVGLVIVDALIVLVVIGAIKFLWK